MAGGTCSILIQLNFSVMGKRKTETIQEINVCITKVFGLHNIVHDLATCRYHHGDK